MTTYKAKPRPNLTARVWRRRALLTVGYLLTVGGGTAGGVGIGVGVGGLVLLGGSAALLGLLMVKDRGKS